MGTLSSKLRAPQQRAELVLQVDQRLEEAAGEPLRVDVVQLLRDTDERHRRRLVRRVALEHLVDADEQLAQRLVRRRPDEQRPVTVAQRELDDQGGRGGRLAGTGTGRSAADVRRVHRPVVVRFALRRRRQSLDTAALRLVQREQMRRGGRAFVGHCGSVAEAIWRAAWSQHVLNWRSAGLRPPSRPSHTGRRSPPAAAEARRNRTRRRPNRPRRHRRADSAPDGRPRRTKASRRREA